MNLTQHIKSLRQEKNISQAAMAEKIGTSKSDYFYLERHTNKLTFGQLQNMAQALNVSLPELITGEPAGKSSPGNRFLHLTDNAGNHWAIGSAQISMVHFSPTGIIITHANGGSTYLDNSYSKRLMQFLGIDESEFSVGQEMPKMSVDSAKKRELMVLWSMLAFYFFRVMTTWNPIKWVIASLKRKT